MESPFILPKLSKVSLEEPVRPLKIAFSTVSPIGGKVSESAIAATKKAARALESLGHHVHEISDQPLNGIEAMQSYYIMNSVETAAMFDSIEAGLGHQMTPEDMELMTWAIFQSGQKIPAKVYSKVLTQWDQYSHQMAHFHQTYDVLLTPTVAEVALSMDSLPSLKTYKINSNIWLILPGRHNRTYLGNVCGQLRLDTFHATSPDGTTINFFTCLSG